MAGRFDEGGGAESKPQKCSLFPLDDTLTCSKHSSVPLDTGPRRLFATSGHLHTLLPLTLLSFLISALPTIFFPHIHTLATDSADSQIIRPPIFLHTTEMDVDK